MLPQTIISHVYSVHRAEQSRAEPCHAEPGFTRQYEHIWGRGKCSCSSACCTVSSHVCAAAGLNLGRCCFAACYGQDGVACQQQQALKLLSPHRPRPQLLLTGCSILPTISYQLPDIHAIVICRPFSCFLFVSVMMATRCDSMSKDGASNIGRVARHSIFRVQTVM